jgi:hypothetical protein
MLRLAGIVALFVLAAACGQTPVKTPASPSPVIPAGNWTQSLTFMGEMPGQMTGIAIDTATQQSACTGAKTRNGQPWSMSFFAPVDSSGLVWQFTVVVDNFRGPGTYANSSVAIAFQLPDNTRAWINQGTDKVTFVIDRSQQSGAIDAFLTNAISGKSGLEHVGGHWNCRG